MAQICGPQEGAKLLQMLGIDTDKLCKAVITIAVDSIVTIETERFGEWDAETEDYKRIADTYGVVLLEPKDTKPDGPSPTP